MYVSVPFSNSILEWLTYDKATFPFLRGVAGACLAPQSAFPADTRKALQGVVGRNESLRFGCFRVPSP